MVESVTSRPRWISTETKERATKITRASEELTVVLAVSRDKLGIRRDDHPFDVTPEPFAQLDVVLVDPRLPVQLLDFFERLVEPDEPVLCLAPFRPPGPFHSPDPGLDRPRRAGLFRKPGVEQRRDEGRPHVEIRGFRSPHPLVERVFEALAEDVDDGRSEDRLPEVRQVVEEENRRATRASAEIAGARLERIRQGREDVVCVTR